MIIRHAEYIQQFQYKFISAFPSKVLLLWDPEITADWRDPAEAGQVQDDIYVLAIKL